MNLSSIGDSRPATDTAGSIRAAGGAFARMEVAHEEEYFCKQVSRNLKLSANFLLLRCCLCCLLFTARNATPAVERKEN